VTFRAQSPAALRHRFSGNPKLVSSVNSKLQNHVHDASISRATSAREHCTPQHCGGWRTVSRRRRGGIHHMHCRSASPWPWKNRKERKKSAMKMRTRDMTTAEVVDSPTPLAPPVVVKPQAQLTCVHNKGAWSGRCCWWQIENKLTFASKRGHACWIAKARTISKQTIGTSAHATTAAGEQVKGRNYGNSRRARCSSEAVCLVLNVWALNVQGCRWLWRAMATCPGGLPNR